MAFLDFIKNRDAQRPAAEQQSQQQKPDNAREHFARQDAQDKAALKPLDGLPAQPKADLDEVKARMEKASQHLHQDASAPAPQDSASSPEAARQNMSNQEKATPELSPTSMQAGTTVSEKDAPAVASEPPAKEEPKPTPTPDPSPTPSPRGRGWER